MSNNLIKIGNLVNYVGGLQDFCNKNGQIISIDKTCDDKESFLMKVVDYKKQAHEIRTCQNEVWPITLNVAHLEKLGFVKEKERNVFSLETLVLIRPIFIYHTEQGVSYIDKGFVVVEKNVKLPLNEDEVDASTTPVTSLHSLQNYLEGKLGKVIDWGIFL